MTPSASSRLTGLQPLDPAQARRGSEAHPGGQLDVVLDQLSSPPTDAPRRAAARATARLAAPVCLGTIPLGIAFGLLVLHAGLPWWWATVFSAVVHAGSLEFLLVAMVAAAVPLAQVELTALMVNSRHVFYAPSFPLHRVRGAVGRTYSSFAITDEAHALTTAPDGRRWSSGRILLLVRHARERRRGEAARA